MMDPATIQRLAREHPESYRGGHIDRGRPISQRVTTTQAWANAQRCLDDDVPWRAAYWAGYALGREGE